MMETLQRERAVRERGQGAVWVRKGLGVPEGNNHGGGMRISDTGLGYGVG